LQWREMRLSISSSKGEKKIVQIYAIPGSGLQF
jgi:hypothetical protein